MSMPSAGSLFLSTMSLVLAGSGLQAQEGKHIVHASAEGRRAEGLQSNPSGHIGGAARGGAVSGPADIRRLDSPGRVTHNPRRLDGQGRPVPVPVVPSFSARCTVVPTPAYWQHRDIFKEIQRAARSGGYLPITDVADTLTELKGVAMFPAGWKAYGFVVPPSGKLHVRLRHPNEGWFRVSMSNKWGNLEKGMLQNLIPTGNPESTFLNPSTTKAQAVYVIVDDPGWMSSEAKPFQIDIERSWQAGSFDPKGITKVQGIWAVNNSKDSTAVQATAQANPTAMKP